MGRLENIIARNRRGYRPRERTLVTLGAGLILLLILTLFVFTDLGMPPELDRAPASGAPASGAPAASPPRDDGRVRDIKLWHPPAVNGSGSSSGSTLNR